MASKHLRILCVEDDEIIRQVTVEGLRDAGYDVVEAKDGDEAMNLMRYQHDIGVVFTDVQMPGLLDGVGLVEKIRQDNPCMPVIVTSGYGLLLTERLSRLKSPMIFLGKPYTLSKVLEKLQEVTKSVAS
jgi:CheY-like chemotaxis protein